MKNPVWADFLEYVSHEDDTEYGDFKREVDAHLRHTVEQSAPLSISQQQKIVDTRNFFLWIDHENDEIESVKRRICSELRDLASPSV